MEVKDFIMQEIDSIMYSNHSIDTKINFWAVNFYMEEGSLH